MLCFPTGGFAGTNESFALRKTTRSAAKMQGKAARGRRKVKRWARELATETKQPLTSQKTRLEERNLGKCLRKPGAPKPPGAWVMPRARWHRAGKSIRRGAPRQARFLQKISLSAPFVFPGIISFPRESLVVSPVIFMKCCSASEGRKGN